MATDFEIMVGDEMPNRVASTEASQTAGNYPRYTGTAKLTTERAPAEVLSDIGGAESGHGHAHGDLSGVTSDQHHAQSHTLGSHSTKAHSELTGVSSDQHHAEAHSLASHSSKAHSELTGVSADQHHAEAHTLASHSTKAHSELTGVTADQHHAQGHALTTHSDVAAKTGTGTTVVMQTSPTLTTPTVADLQNMTHDHSDAAGGGALTAKNRTWERTLQDDPPSATLVVVLKYFKHAATITHVKHITKADTVTWMLEIREGSPLATGGDVHDVFSGDKTSTTTMQTETSFADATIPADSFLVYVATSLTGTPLQLFVTPNGTID